jgi:hypothetical protein
MATVPTSSPSAVTLDASFVIAYCAQEATRYAKAKAYLDYHAQSGSDFFAPGVVIAEALFVFCRKLIAGDISGTEHGQAVSSLELLMAAVMGPPNGDRALIARAGDIRRWIGAASQTDRANRASNTAHAVRHRTAPATGSSLGHGRRPSRFPPGGLV